MLTLFFDGNRNVHLKNQPVPDRADGEILVRVSRAGVCQTDVAVYRGEGSTVVAGSEFTGRVVEVGPETMNFGVGDRVVSYDYLPCGTCPACRADTSYLCTEGTAIAELPQGGFAEYVSLPERYFLPLPDDIDDELGVLIPHEFGMMSCAMRQLDIRENAFVGVVGLQPFGLGAVALAKLAGARVVGFDTTKYRRSLASSVGADVVIDSTEPCLYDKLSNLTNGAMFDFMIECDEPLLRIERIFSWIRPGGTLCLQGHTGETVQLDTDWVTRREITVTGSPRYPADTHEEVLDLLRKCPAARSMITHRPTIKEAKKALDEYVIDRAGKIVLTFMEDRHE